MKRFLIFLVLLTGLWGTQNARAFVLVGPMNATELGSGGIDFNYTDDLGGPKDLKTFFRWNIPLLTYAFDASFMQYFGLEGREAVKEAFTAVNDFFENDQYSGVSSLDLTTHGFRSNYNSSWLNTTAKNGSVIDVKSLTLGLIINHLGLGNPYRYAYGIHSISTNSAGTQLNFNVRLRNFDPITYKPTSIINNVAFSYRLIHDAPPSVGVTQLPSFADMEEFTTDTTGNAWTSLSAITDAFYGNTAIFWTEQPTLFGFGVYYDGQNAMGGQYQPRHALTYDDAGGLKYLYRTNNYVYEGLDPNVVLMTPANFLPTFAIPVLPGGSGRIFPDPSGISGAFIPRRNAGIIPGLPITSSLPVQAPPALVDVAMRGGIDKIEFREQQFDSFLGINFTAATHEWTDVFVSTNGQNVVNLNNTTPGSSAFIGVPTLKHFSQKVGRAIFQPDILFVADELGVSPDGIPIAFNRTDFSAWIDNYTNNLGPAQLLTTNVGPGIISGPIQYTFTKLGQGFEVIWSGEASVVGNTNSYSMWGHIKGPGPKDVVVFPNDAQMSILENAISPATTTPVITRIIDSGQDNRLARTQEKLIVEGSNLASATAVQILDGDVVLETIQGSIIQTFIESHNQIIIPPGHITEAAEGDPGTRKIVIWNTIGKSDPSEAIGIHTGIPVITGTSRDEKTYDRAEHNLDIYGYGFKSRQIGDIKSELSFFRVEDENGTVVFPASGNSTLAEFQVRSDSHAILPINAITALADGKHRRIRVARDSAAASLSSTNAVDLIEFITSTPKITGLFRGSTANPGVNDINATSTFRRDDIVTIQGEALNTTYRIEIVDINGSSLDPAVHIDIPTVGVAVADGGNLIQLSKDTFFTGTADGNGTDAMKMLKISNLIGTSTSEKFNVNAQPEVTFIAGFVTPFTFNRDASTGDTITLTGLNLRSVTEIQVVDENGTDLDTSNPPKIILPANGVTITDTAITINSRAIQFSNTAKADSSLLSSKWRRFKLISAREPALSPQIHRFQMGVPPKFTSFQLSPGSSGNSNYRRDADSMEVSGSGFGLINSAEVVDVNGNTIVANSGVTIGSAPNYFSNGLTLNTDANFTIAPDSFFNANLLDSPVADHRRLKITTPFGIVVSDQNGTGAFTLSATPLFHSTVTATFAGEGSGFNGIDTYDINGTTGVYPDNLLPLVINGQNFLGVKTITFEDNATTSYYSVNVNPANPPAGLAFSADGKKITVSGKLIYDNALTWANSGGAATRRVVLTSAGEQNATTQNIIADPSENDNP